MRAPRLNANDDSVTLTRWLVADRSVVSAGAAIAEIETEKAATDLYGADSAELASVDAAWNGVNVK